MLTAVVTVLGTVWVARARAKIDVGASLTSSFKELTDQLQEEREQLRKVIDHQERELREADKRLRLKRRHIATLEGKLERAGIPFTPWSD